LWLAWTFVPTPLDELRVDALACTQCKLATAGRTQVVFGVGDPGTDLLFVGEGPGAEEDRLGEPFVGRSGKLLDKLMLEELGLTRDRCYIANVVKCRPPGNRDPEPDEVATCRPWLERQLDLIDPAVVITLGKFAAQLLLDDKRAISKLRGRPHPFRRGVLIPTWHPAYALRGGAGPLAEMRADFVRAKLALASAGSPLVEAPGVHA
jgi:uracil-DNA glycosylase family 4